ncbi:MAG: NUDIX hydrolase [Candidatus Saccharimonadales bacterium]
MRKKVWPQLGKLTFWLGWPALWVYLRIGWRTRILVVADGKLLLVKSWLGTSQWGLPGGGLHAKEEPVAGALRELKEETSLKLNPDQLKFLYKGKAHHHGLGFRYWCYVVELPKPLPIRKQQLEITNVAWRPIANLAEDSVTGETWAALAAWKQS